MGAAFTHTVPDKGKDKTGVLGVGTLRLGKREFSPGVVDVSPSGTAPHREESECFPLRESSQSLLDKVHYSSCAQRRFPPRVPRGSI